MALITVVDRRLMLSVASCTVIVMRSIVRIHGFDILGLFNQRGFVMADDTLGFRRQIILHRVIAMASGARYTFSRVHIGTHLRFVSSINRSRECKAQN